MSLADASRSNDRVRWRLAPTVVVPRMNGSLVAALYDYFSPAGKVDANEMTLCGNAGSWAVHGRFMGIGGHRRAVTMRRRMAVGAPESLQIYRKSRKGRKGK